jgi:hypothetical protein
VPSSRSVVLALALAAAVAALGMPGSAGAATSDCMRLVETVPTPTMPTNNPFGVHGGSGPVNTVYNPSTGVLFAGGPNDSSIEDPGTLVAVDRATGATLATIQLPGVPFGALAINTVTNRVYAGNRKTGTISVIDGNTFQIVATIPMADTGLVFALAVDAEHDRVYAYSISHETGQWEGTYSIIDGATDTIVKSVTDIALGVGYRQTESMALDVVHDRLYTADDFGTVLTLEASTLTLVHRMSVPAGPIDVAIDPSASRLYVLENPGTLEVFDPASYGSLGSVSSVGNAYGSHMAFDAARGRIYVPTDGGIGVIDTGAMSIVEIAQSDRAYSLTLDASTGDVFISGMRSFGIGVYQPRACAATDADAPVVSVSTPADGATYPIYALVPANWSCADAGSGLAESPDPDLGTAFCPATAPVGQFIDTITPGTKTFTVSATDRNGLTTSVTHSYTVVGIDDTTPPAITVDSPVDGSTFTRGESVTVHYSCDDGGSGAPMTYCQSGNGLASGDLLPTSQLGDNVFAVQSGDWAGNSGEVEIHYTVVAATDVDSDGNGVADSIDSGNGTFFDSNVSPPTSGAISDTAGNSVLVTDAPAPDGVHITVSGSGTAKSVFSVCGFATLRLPPGSDVIVTCGSVTVHVTGGSAEIVLAGGASTVAIPAGVTARVADTGGGGFTVQNLGGGTLTTTTNGASSTIAPGQSASVDTTAPVITATVTGTLGNNGWYRGNVSVTWAVSDGQSPVNGRTGCGASSVTADTAGRAFTCSATSAGGRATKTLTVKRDATAPQAAYASHASSYTVDQSVSFACTSSDALSGIVTPCQAVNAPAYTFPLGTVTRSSTATDRAGNTRTVSTSFKVTVTGASVCNLTSQFVHASSKYLAATKAQRVAPDAVVKAGCLALSSIKGNTTAKQKAALIATYRAAVAALGHDSWLTNSQATTLGSLAGSL